MGNRLLLADDSITIQKVVAIIFANEEFELTVVDNGNAALDKARDIQPDLMLVDALMPGKTGYEVCAEIRRDPKLGTLPLLLLIGAFEPLDEDKARSCGADATITKPFESQQLIDKVKELLELGKTRKAAPAPAAAPQPAAPAAEDVWGDLSALDTMTGFAEPAAAPAAGSADFGGDFFAEPAPAAPQAPAAAAQGGQAPFLAETSQSPAQVPPAAAAALQAEEEILEATYEDDLWGAFELEEIAEAPAASSEFGVVEPEGEYETEQLFTFEEEGEEIEETGTTLELVEEPAAGQASADELFSFEDETAFELTTEAEAAPEPEALQLPEYEPFSFEEDVVELAPVEAAAPPQPAPIPALEPQAAPLEFAAPAAPVQAAAAAYAPEAPAAPQAQPQAQPAATGLSEADLVAALSKISREVIERIVWEVVPDLAEMLIKEEIKKLKDGVRG